MDVLTKEYDPSAPVESSSAVLFRLGSLCQNRCPMCSNYQRTEKIRLTELELSRRVSYLLECGFRHLVLTGGEPTLNEHFWPIVTRLGREGARWSMISNGRSFSNPEQVTKLSSHRPSHALVSLHSHEAATVTVLVGGQQEAFTEAVQGIQALLSLDVSVAINCVLTRLSLNRLKDYLSFCERTFGVRCPVTLTFPSLYSKGMDWEPLQLTYCEVAPALVHARRHAEELGLELFFQNVPFCVLGDSHLPLLNREGFGITHYLDEDGGRTLYSIEFAESNLNAFAMSCRDCSAFESCVGVE